jgi:hypothetical protein
MQKLLEVKFNGKMPELPVVKANGKVPNSPMKSMAKCQKCRVNSFGKRPIDQWKHGKVPAP